MRILFLSAWYPYPPNNGSKLRIYNLIRGLAQQHEVSLLTFTDEIGVNANSVELQALCQEVWTVQRKPFDPGSRRALLGFLSIAPRAVVDTFSPEMEQRVRQILTQKAYDLVVASQIMIAGYAHCFQDLPAIFEEVEVGVLYEQFSQAASAGRRLRYGLTWAKHRRYLAHLLRRFQACTVVSERERELLYQAVGNGLPVEIVPNGVDGASYDDVRVTPERNTLIFTGSFSYSPNYEAMVWFLGEVYPHVQAKVPDVRLIITGDHGNRPLPPAENVTLTGFVDDVRPLIAASWISLAPLLVGGGTRLKILEAMALGSPVVATSKGAEGLEVENNRHILTADTPEIFAEAVVRLLKDQDLRRQVSENARQLVDHKYDWTVVMPRFLNLIEEVAHV